MDITGIDEIKADTSSEIACMELNGFPTLSEETKSDILVVNTYSSSMEEFKESLLHLMHVDSGEELIQEMIHIVNVSVTCVNMYTYSCTI